MGLSIKNIPSMMKRCNMEVVGLEKEVSVFSLKEFSQYVSSSNREEWKVVHDFFLHHPGAELRLLPQKPDSVTKAESTGQSMKNCGAGMAKCLTCQCTAIDGFHLCPDCLGMYISQNKQRDADALILIREICDRLSQLKKMICLRCASGCPSACNQFVLHQDHASDPCDAWQFSLISTAVDDLRDEHFNTRFNPSHGRRFARTEEQQTGQGVCPVCMTVKR